jgi:hypothetical protein
MATGLARALELMRLLELNTRGLRLPELVDLHLEDQDLGLELDHELSVDFKVLHVSD